MSHHIWPMSRYLKALKTFTLVRVTESCYDSVGTVEDFESMWKNFSIKTSMKQDKNKKMNWFFGKLKLTYATVKNKNLKKLYESFFKLTHIS